MHTQNIQHKGQPEAKPTKEDSHSQAPSNTPAMPANYEPSNTNLQGTTTLNPEPWKRMVKDTGDEARACYPTHPPSLLNYVTMFTYSHQHAKADSVSGHAWVNLPPTYLYNFSCSEWKRTPFSLHLLSHIGQ